MQLDKMAIVIRERSLLEIMDLAPRLIRAYAGPILLAAFLGCLPLLVLNFVLFYSQLEAMYFLATNSRYYYGGIELGFSYFWWMLYVSIVQIPLATAPLTLLMGQILFRQPISAKKIAKDYLHSLPQLLLYQVFLRGMYAVLVLPLMFVYAFRPYVNEIILLERNPLVKRNNSISTRIRSRVLHAGESGIFITQALGCGLFSLAMIFVMWAGAEQLVDLVSSTTALQSQLISYGLLLPVSIWAVFGFMAIVRFLGYLNLRICREGWEVELRLRTEGAKLARGVEL